MIRIYVVIALFVHDIFGIDNALSHVIKILIRYWIDSCILVGQDKMYVLIYKGIAIWRAARHKALKPVARHHTFSPFA